MPMPPLRTLLLLALGAGLAAAPALAGERVALRAARALTADGKVVAPATLIIEDGKIVSLSDQAPPAGMKVIDHGQATLIPGLVAAASQVGVDGDANDQSSEITPSFKIAGSLDRTHRTVHQALRRGLTTAYVRPGIYNVIGGQGAVVRPGADGFLLRADRELTVCFGPWPSWGNGTPERMGSKNPFARRPNTRMGVVWLARKSFFDAARFVQQGRKVGSLSKEAPGPYRAEELAALAEALAGDRPVRLVARSDGDVRAALRVAKEVGLWQKGKQRQALRIEGLLEGYRGPQADFAALDALIVDVVDGDPVNGPNPVLSLPLEVVAFQCWLAGVHPSACECCSLLMHAAQLTTAPGAGVRQVRARYGVRADNVRLLARTNPRLALNTQEAAPDLLGAGSWVVRHGVTPADALAMITRIPAELLGLGDQIGTLAKGKRADVVVLSGAPFELTTRVLAVYSDGEKAYDADQEIQR